MVFSTFVPKQSFATALLFLLVACVASQEEHHQQQQTSHIRMSNADAEAVAAATHPEELSLSSSSLSVESHQHHRRAIFSLASRACLAGLPAPCLCTEEGVLAAIASSGGGSANATNKVFLGRPKVIQICSGTYIDITAAIDITGKSFRLRCFPNPLPGNCGLDGGRTNQLLVGAPTDVTLFGVSLDRAVAGNGTTNNNGGAIAITGGKLTLKETQFFLHRADTGRGGALYATGIGTKISISSCRFEGNRALIGGAFFIANGAELVIKRTAFLSNNATQGGAMGFFDATASLQSLTISGNLATVSGSDLAILGNSTRDSTGFVDCASGALGLFPNLFCDGLEGIFDGSSNNTNCAANGKTSGTRCDLA